MLIDFSQIKEVKIPGMNDGTGEMSARMYMDEQGKSFQQQYIPEVLLVYIGILPVMISIM